MIQWRKIISFDFQNIPKLSIGFKESPLKENNSENMENLKQKRSEWKGFFLSPDHHQSFLLATGLSSANEPWQSY